MKKVIISNNLDFKIFFENFDDIKNKNDFLFFVRSLYEFFEKKFDGIIKEVEKNNNEKIEIKDIDLFLFWKLIDGNIDSKIHIYEMRKKIISLKFSKEEIKRIEDFLNYTETEILDVESYFQVYELWSKNNIYKWRKKVKDKKVEFFDSFKIYK